MRKSIIVFFILATIATMAFSPGLGLAKNSGEIIHDGEFNFLKAQHEEVWAKEDQQIDEKLADLRKNNGGKRPNIVYVLIDDVSFGQMGNRTMGRNPRRFWTKIDKCVRCQVSRFFT